MPTKICSLDQGTWDLLVQIDDKETLWVLSKNPRGFCFEEGHDYKTTAGIEYFHDIQTGIVMAQEINTDWKQFRKSRLKLRNKLFKHWKYHNLIILASDTKAKISAYLPGKTAMAVLGKWSQRVVATGNDKKQGRWSWVQLQGITDSNVNYTNIRIINAYRVCQTQVTDGIHTSYMQQCRGCVGQIWKVGSIQTTRRP